MGKFPRANLFTCSSLTLSSLPHFNPLHLAKSDPPSEASHWKYYRSPTDDRRATLSSASRNQPTKVADEVIHKATGELEEQAWTPDPPNPAQRCPGKSRPSHDPTQPNSSIRQAVHTTCVRALPQTQSIFNARVGSSREHPTYPLVSTKRSNTTCT